MTVLDPVFPPQRRVLAPRRTLISMAVALALSQYGTALAGPTGAQVVSGQVAVNRPNAQQTVVTQGSANAIVNWQQFSVARGESVEFRQPGAASVILNRVTGSNPSEIYGSLSANGQVFLVNPAGVLFGRTAQVSVGGLVASTLDIADADFQAGRYRFTATAASGSAAGTVVNQGQLQAAERGTVALLGAKVNNDGTISARLGTAALVAGDKIALDFNGDGLTKIRVDQAALAAQVDNRGMVVADGGQAILTAHAAQALTETVLNQQGVVRAQSLVERNGKITLDGGASGVTLTSGTLDVSGSAPGLTGGSAEVLGHQVGLVGDALIDARGDAGGGTILVGGDYQGANPLVRNADATFAGSGATLRAEATGSGDGGKVILWSQEATRVFGTVSANGGPGGGNGGFIETSGKFLDVAGAKISAAGPRGKAGQWLLDPDNILIASCEFDSCGDSSITQGPNFTNTQGDARLTPATLVAALGGGTAVSVTTGETADRTPSEFDGNITVIENIQYMGARDATLTLTAHQNIQIGSNVEIRAGNGSTNDATVGRLNVTLRSDSDGRDGGGILMNSGSQIITNGGDVEFTGGSSTSATGFSNGWIQLGYRSQILTTRSDGSGGSVTMRTDDGGIELFGASINSGTGAVSLTGTTNSAAGTFAAVQIGQGFPVEEDGPPLVPSTIVTSSGNISITGTASANAVLTTGVALYDSSIRTDSGRIEIKGTGGGSGSGTINIGNGLDLNNFQLHANKGNVILTGIGANGSGDDVGAFNGVNALQSVIDSTDGTIDIRGRAGIAASASPTGVSLESTTLATSGASGAITISGESPGPSAGVRFSGTSVIGGDNTSGVITSGVITIRALNAAGGAPDMINLGGTVKGSGVLNLRPGGVDAAGELTEAPTTPIGLFGAGAAFSLDQNELTQVIQPGFASVVIGSTTHTGPITVASGADFGGRSDLTLQNGGAGSGGIALAGGLSNGVKRLTLSSGGAVTQGGPIVAGSLLLHGTQPESNFQLTDSQNSVGQFSAHFDTPKAAGANFGDVNFVNSGDLDIHPLIGTGFVAATNLPDPIRADAAVVAGNLFAHAGHDLVLSQNVSTLGSDISLVADHVFNNTANSTLTPGGGGHWKVFADSWIGESAGPLVGSGATPNLYNCGYGERCMAALPPGDNQFVYRQQPRVDVSLVVPNPVRLYGSENPAFNFTATGLVKGDAPGTALSGAYATTATATSNVQSYPIDGQFVSPAGYLVVVAPGALRVDPVTLTYVAAPAVRVPGSPMQPLGGTVTGFVAGDTLASATTGALSFTSPAGADAAPGRYAVNGGGLAALNYVFVQALANATALTVDPSSLARKPSIIRDVTFESSSLYGKNFGVQRLCAGTGPLARAAGTPDTTDVLAMEWARVKENPNLSNCIGLVRRYSCDNF